MEETGVIDWTSEETHVLLNPRITEEERTRLQRLAASASLPAHVWVATSGSTGAVKLVALSKRAILASAAAVNSRLESSADDVWCCVLPMFHVGGMGIHARAHLLGSRVVSMEWDPNAFANAAVTLASLVPAQVHDLVRMRLRPPRSLRAILVGGGSFNRELQESARTLGWPVLASYGMTECASTVAVEDVLLPHLESKSVDLRLAFRGASLLTGWIVNDRSFEDPKVDGWFQSEDIGSVEGRALRVEGRPADFIKIGGESVDLRRLDVILESVRGEIDAALIPVSDSRLGQVIHLASTVESQSVIEAFNERVLPFERIRASHLVATIPRSSLGKLLRQTLAKMIAE